jgi:hypothetical protein
MDGRQEPSGGVLFNWIALREKCKHIKEEANGQRVAALLVELMTFLPKRIDFARSAALPVRLAIPPGSTRELRFTTTNNE